MSILNEYDVENWIPIQGFNIWEECSFFVEIDLRIGNIILELQIKFEEIK